MITITIAKWYRSDVFDYKTQEKHKANNKRFGNASFAKPETNFPKQLGWRFQRSYGTKGDRADAIGLGSRLSASNEMFVDEDARNAEAMDIKRLSIFHWGDLLKIQAGQRIVMQFRHNKRSNLQKEPFNSMPLMAADVQKKNGVAGDLKNIGGIKFLTLEAEIVLANLHHEVIAGDLTPAQLKVHFRQKQGFTISTLEQIL